MPTSGNSLEYKRPKVTIISVATETETFWNEIHNLAKAAANDLGADLEILYSYRYNITAMKLAQEVSNRKNKPDYVIVIGENLIASRSIPVLSDSGIKVLMFGNLTDDEKK